MSGSAHGHTTAAWTAVGVSFAGFIVAAIGMLPILGGPTPWLVGAGLVIAALGAVVGKAMSMAGFGKKPGDSPSITSLTKKSTVSSGV